MKIASICQYCRRIMPANTRCSCRPPARVDERTRMARQPYREAYKHPSYARNRKRRYTLAGGRCEACGQPVGPREYECHHVRPVRLFANPADANAIDNLRVMHRECHRRLKG